MKLKIVRKKMDKDILHLTFYGGINVYSVPKLKDVLIKEFELCSEITMDLEMIDEADTAGFQLLLFLKREAKMAGKILMITGMSSRLRSIFTLYNETI